MKLKIGYFISVCTFACYFFSAAAHALIITNALETQRISNVGANWRVVNLQNTFISPVVVCTYALPSAASNEAAVRIRNVGVGDFEIKIQRPENSAAVTPADVYCVIAEQGLHTLPDGREFEAHTVISDGTNGLGRGWGVGGVNGAENVSASILGTYPANSQPTVIGQVMTAADDEFSVFWSFDCDNRRNVPFQSNLADGICVGKHVGQISGATSDRANETLGYIIIEQGASPTGNFSSISYIADLGGAAISGVGNSPPYSYGLGAHYDLGAATQEAENGGQGGWAVLYGDEPLDGNNIDLGIDEETIQGDMSRTHLPEQVGFWLFRGTDHSDAPMSYGDASHNVSGVLSLGAIAAGDADAEVSPQHSALATGDDMLGIDDEDGVVFRSPAGSGQSVIADVIVHNPKGQTVNVCGWLDQPNGGVVDGVFDAADGQCQVTTDTNPVLTFQWQGQPTDQGYVTFARFRITQDAMNVNNAIGAASDGEVEDYRVPFDFTPTIATIGQVELESVLIEELVWELGLEQANANAIMALLKAWSPHMAQPDTDPTIAQAHGLLSAYLDPDDNGEVVIFRWETLQELGTIGFYVDRKSIGGSWVRINNELLPGLVVAPYGGQYLLADPGLSATASDTGNAFFHYRLTELEADGSLRTYGPFAVDLQ